MWPFSRRPQVGASPDTAPAAVPAGQLRAWSSLPPLQRSLTQPPLTVNTRHARDVAIFRSPALMSSGLHHAIDQGAPSGLLFAVPVLRAPSHSPGADMPLVPEQTDAPPLGAVTVRREVGGSGAMAGSRTVGDPRPRRNASVQRHAAAQRGRRAPSGPPVIPSHAGPAVPPRRLATVRSDRAWAATPVLTVSPAPERVMPVLPTVDQSGPATMSRIDTVPSDAPDAVVGAIPASTSAPTVSAASRGAVEVQPEQTPPRSSRSRPPSRPVGLGAPISGTPPTPLTDEPGPPVPLQPSGASKPASGLPLVDVDQPVKPLPATAAQPNTAVGVPSAAAPGVGVGARPEQSTSTTAVRAAAAAAAAPAPAQPAPPRADPRSRALSQSVDDPQPSSRRAALRRASSAGAALPVIPTVQARATDRTVSGSRVLDHARTEVTPGRDATPGTSVEPVRPLPAVATPRSSSPATASSSRPPDLPVLGSGASLTRRAEVAEVLTSVPEQQAPRGTAQADSDRTDGRPDSTTGHPLGSHQPALLPISLAASTRATSLHASQPASAPGGPTPQRRHEPVPHGTGTGAPALRPRLPIVGANGPVTDVMSLQPVPETQTSSDPRVPSAPLLSAGPEPMTHASASTDVALPGASENARSTGASRTPTMPTVAGRVMLSPTSLAAPPPGPGSGPGLTMASAGLPGTTLPPAPPAPHLSPPATANLPMIGLRLSTGSTSSVPVVPPGQFAAPAVSSGGGVMAPEPSVSVQQTPIRHAPPTRADLRNSGTDLSAVLAVSDPPVPRAHSTHPLTAAPLPSRARATALVAPTSSSVVPLLSLRRTALPDPTHLQANTLTSHVHTAASARPGPTAAFAAPVCGPQAQHQAVSVRPSPLLGLPAPALSPADTPPEAGSAGRGARGRPAPIQRARNTVASTNSPSSSSVLRPVQQQVDGPTLLAQAHREAEALVRESDAHRDGTKSVVLREADRAAPRNESSATAVGAAGTLRTEARAPDRSLTELTDDEVDAQARRLYPRIRSLFAAELRRDRERAGLTIDIRR